MRLARQFAGEGVGSAVFDVGLVNDDDGATARHGEQRVEVGAVEAGAAGVVGVADEDEFDRLAVE